MPSKNWQLIRARVPWRFPWQRTCSESCLDATSIRTSVLLHPRLHGVPLGAFSACGPRRGGRGRARSSCTACRMRLQAAASCLAGKRRRRRVRDGVRDGARPALVSQMPNSSQKLDLRLPWELCAIRRLAVGKNCGRSYGCLVSAASLHPRRTTRQAGCGERQRHASWPANCFRLHGHDGPPPRNTRQTGPAEDIHCGFVGIVCVSSACRNETDRGRTGTSKDLGSRPGGCRLRHVQVLEPEAIVADGRALACVRTVQCPQWHGYLPRIRPILRDCRCPKRRGRIEQLFPTCPGRRG
jgi:hypothetical protein